MSAFFIDKNSRSKSRAVFFCGIVLELNLELTFFVELF